MNGVFSNGNFKTLPHSPFHHYKRKAVARKHDKSPAPTIAIFIYNLCQQHLLLLKGSLLRKSYLHSNKWKLVSDQRPALQYSMYRFPKF